MGNLSTTGRIFYGIAILGIGLTAIYYRELPYILSLPEYFSITAHIAFAIGFGVVFTLGGACIALGKNPGQIILLFAGMLLAIFCFYCIPYEFITGENYGHLQEWENAAKELTLAGGAFVIAGCFTRKNKSPTRSLTNLIPIGAILFSVTIIFYGILHFLFAEAASAMIPAWIPAHIFWMYFCGVALMGSGIAIIIKIKTNLIATLLGTMILIWFIFLHIPRVIAAPAADMKDEITSAFFALAYSGIAFVVAGVAGKRRYLLKFGR
jgi:hypothetical protein